MIIRYSNSVDDLVAQRRYSFRHKPQSWGKKYFVSIIGWTIVLVAIIAALFAVGWGDWWKPLAMVYGLTMMGSVVFGEMVATPLLRLDKIDPNACDASFSSEYELEIVNDDLVVRHHFGTWRIESRIISSIDVTDTHMFIFTSELDLCIPKSKISAGSYNTFLDEVMLRHKRNRRPWNRVWRMVWADRVRSYKSHKKEYSPGEIYCDEKKVSMKWESSEGSQCEDWFAWDAVAYVEVFKRDLFAVDCVCMYFGLDHECAGKIRLPHGWPHNGLELNEDMGGWVALLDLVQSTLPGFPNDERWWDGVVRPAFETNATRLWTRDEPNGGPVYLLD